jgi:hypothetical protein
MDIGKTSISVICNGTVKYSGGNGEGYIWIMFA